MTVPAAERFLIDRQHPDGGWGYTVHNRDTFLEPTAWATAALRQGGHPVDAAVDLLLAAQHADGGWANVPAMPSDMTTARVVFALAALPHCRSAVAKGADWVLRQQLPDGGWGWCSGTTGFIETATYAIVALAAARRLTDPERLVSYVQGLACTDGGWCSHVPAKMGFAQASQPSVTPLGIVALAASLDLLTGWITQHRLTTPYSLATALWALTEVGALSAAATLRTAATRVVPVAANVWHTAMLCYGLRRLGPI
jgi:squalene cyclase